MDCRGALVRGLTVGMLSLACVGGLAQDGGSGLPAAPMPAAGVVGSAGTATLAYGVAVEHGTAGALALGLDDAIERGLEKNLQVELARQNQAAVHGELLTVGNALLPGLTVDLRTETQQINLAAMGFKPASLAAFGLPVGSFHEIVKVDTTSASLRMEQQLFNVPAYYLYRAAQKAERAAEMTTLNVRGNVVLAVGTQYLQALAATASIENAKSLEKADAEVLRQATASHDAGVGTNLDVLRARVQLQTQQQVVINAENALAKDKIALNRLIGLPAEQELELTDTAPYAAYATLSQEDALKLAFERRKDLLDLEAQMEVARQSAKAVRSERLPSLSFKGFYGVLGETQGLYHGVFSAQGTLSVPIFQEAQQRGEREVAAAQMIALKQHIASLRVTIDAQIRSAMLDVKAADELVKVAQSNVELSTQELQDATDRFSAGVDDNLAVVQAQAALAAAQSRLVETLYEYNQSKLTLARDTGVVETQYKVYLGR